MQYKVLQFLMAHFGFFVNCVKLLDEDHKKSLDLAFIVVP